jgi:hypothetical protein
MLTARQLAALPLGEVLRRAGEGDQRAQLLACVIQAAGPAWNAGRH